MSAETLVSLLICCGTLGGLNLAAVRFILNQHQAGTHQKLEEVRREGREHSHGVAGDLTKLKAELPQNYVKWEDWIRFGAVIDARLDAMREQVEAVREKLHG
jgi:hypothetical protein